MAGNSVHISPNVRVQVGSGENVDHLSNPQNQASTESNQQMALDDPSVSEQPSTPLENGEQQSTSYVSGDKTSDIDEVDDVLESQSILILLSSQCITKQVICEQSHLSRIKYYGDFDVSLGRYLQDILQNQVTLTPLSFNLCLLVYFWASGRCINLIPTSKLLRSILFPKSIGRICA